ncbi:hypothetical protein LAG90_12600 [Marinilongibacter aquaticus]|uniref:hypothetical protein n=1 Tax=Marinilongibacter aquaticus TaxID=2975157 RepID=UPI0021BD0AC9|nr:hypothetical protein [Marinilongibacter aquaticus]UBM57655.1 hypothetical protein LAG90_12600 [Marinilongibacter aquaticus]
MKARVGFALIFLFASCAKKITSRTQSSKVDGYSEDLSIVRPHVDEQKLDEQPSEKKETDLSKFKLEEPKNDNEQIDRAVMSLANYNARLTEGPGFRIQVFSGNSRSDFESAKGYLLEHFPELEIYESYSQPTYRIKVGDFLKRMDAERYYAALLDRFNSSKVVMDRIDVQKGFNIN